MIVSIDFPGAEVRNIFCADSSPLCVHAKRGSLLRGTVDFGADSRRRRLPATGLKVAACYPFRENHDWRDSVVGNWNFGAKPGIQPLRF
jgi:hypothetical protein